jgi:hypothetical protein
MAFSLVAAAPQACLPAAQDPRERQETANLAPIPVVLGLREVLPALWDDFGRVKARPAGCRAPTLL